MDTNEIIIGIGQIASSVALGGMALLYSHRVHKIEKNRDIQTDRDKLINSFLELSDESHRYFMVSKDLRGCVVDFLGRSIRDNKIWDFLDADIMDLSSNDFAIKVKEEFERLNTFDYGKISIHDYEVAKRFLDYHITYAANVHRICEQLTIEHEIKSLTNPINELKAAVANKANFDIDLRSTDYIFYMYALSNRINKKTIKLIIELKHSFPKKS